MTEETTPRAREVIPIGIALMVGGFFTCCLLSMFFSDAMLYDPRGFALTVGGVVVAYGLVTALLAFWRPARWPVVAGAATAPILMIGLLGFAAGLTEAGWREAFSVLGGTLAASAVVGAGAWLGARVRRRS